MKLEGEIVRDGEARGTALVSRDPISFLGGVDPNTGKIIESEHDLEGESVEGKILVFPHGKGSTVGSYVLYQLVKNGKGPKAIINRKAEAIVAVGTIISDIPMVHRLDRDPLEAIETGDSVCIRDGIVKVEK